MRNNKIYPWLIMLCCCGMSIASMGFTFNCSGLFFAPVADSFHTGIGNISAYMTVINLISGFMGPAVVKILEKTNIKKMLIIAITTTVLGYISMAMVTSVWQIYVIAVLIGISNCCYNMLMITVLIGHWFHIKMGFALGATFSCSGLIGALLSPIFNMVIENYSWRNAYIFAAILLFTVLIPSVFVVCVDPSEVGLKAYGDDLIDHEKQKIIRKKTENVYNSQKNNKEMLIVFFLCSISFTSAFITGITSQMSNYAVTSGYSSAVGALMVSIIMIGNAFAKFASGVLCDTIGPYRTCIIAFSIVAFGMLRLIWIGEGGVITLYTSSLAIGAAYCIANVTLSTMVKDLFGLERFGDIYAKASIPGFVGSAVSYIIFGFSFDYFRSYLPSFCGCVLLAFWGVMAVGCIRKINKY